MSHLLIYSDRNYVIWHFLCLHLNIQSTVSQVPMDFILFIAVSIFRVAHRATALHSDKAAENSFSQGFVWMKSKSKTRKTDTGFISVLV